MYTDFSTSYTDTDSYGGYDSYADDGGYVTDVGFGAEADYYVPEPEPVSCCGTPSFELPPEPPLPPTEPPMYEGQSVIPAGQPGGPMVDQPVETQSVIPAGQPGGPFTDVQAVPVAPEVTPWAPAPDAGLSVIPAGQPGGPALDFGTPELGSEGLYPSMATIGGQPPLEITILDPSGLPVEPASFMPSSTTIGPISPDSTMGNLLDVYEVATSNGDIMSQIGLNKIMDSMHRSTMVWTL